MANDELRALDLNGRLFSQSPQPPSGYRPGQEDRGDFRRIFQQEHGDASKPSLLSDADMARVEYLLRRISALFQNTNITASLPAHSTPDPWATPIDLSALFVLPAVVGAYTTVISYRASPGRWARISGYGVDVDGAFAYDDSILWRVTKNGNPVPTLSDWGQHRGSIANLRDTFILLNGDLNEGEIVTFDVRRAVAAGGPSNVSMALHGWTWRPRFNYEGTKASITSF